MVPNDIKLGLKQVAAKRDTYCLYKDYYEGKHRLAFATDDFRSLFGKMFTEFADNLCPTVVDAVADRLQLQTIQAQDPAAQVAIGEVWDLNRMDQRHNEVHNEALTGGDSYVVVWPSLADPAMPTLYPNSGEMMTIRYDQEEPGRKLWAMKTWLQDEDGKRRVTMYYPDRVERYITKDKAQTFSRLKPDSFTEYSAPTPNPYLEVPVFHFANNAPVGYFGRSELKSVVPLQDVLNKAITDMLVAMEFVALPQRWVAGLELKYNPKTGKVEWPFEAGVDRIWSVDNPDARFGQYDQANLTHFIQTQDGFRTEIARVSRTPLHYVMLMTGDFPSGESQKTAEAPFLAKVADRMVSYGNTWEDVFRFCLRIRTGVPYTGTLESQWKDPAPKSDKEQAETMAIDATLPPPMLKRRGYSDDEIRDISQHQAQNNAGALMDQFTNGSGQ